MPVECFLEPPYSTAVVDPAKESNEANRDGHERVVSRVVSFAEASDPDISSHPVHAEEPDISFGFLEVASLRFHDLRQKG
jgi:hypothetical protein